VKVKPYVLFIVGTVLSVSLASFGAQVDNKDPDKRWVMFSNRSVTSGYFMPKQRSCLGKIRRWENEGHGFSRERPICINHSPEDFKDAMSFAFFNEENPHKREYSLKKLNSMKRVLEDLEYEPSDEYDDDKLKNLKFRIRALLYGTGLPGDKS